MVLHQSAAVSEKLALARGRPLALSMGTDSSFTATACPGEYSGFATPAYLSESNEQIITWNDYGESHYIGAVHNSGMPGISPEDPKGARRYVDGMPHDRWRDLLPYYIEAYKTSSRPAILSDKLHYWYRLSPADAGSCKGTVGNAPWEPHANANNVVQDRVFFTALLKAAAVITIQIGSHPAERFRADIPGPFHSSIPFGGRIGAVQVKIIRENAVVGFGMGARIIASPVDDVTNFNAWVGGLDETK